jgi:type IV secretion system protein VirB1
MKVPVLGSALLAMLVLVVLSPLVCSRIAAGRAAASAASAASVTSVSSVTKESPRELIRSEAWTPARKRGTETDFVPSILRLPGLAEDPAFSLREGVLIAGFPIDKLMLACAREAHPDTMGYLVRRASEAEPWSVGNPGETFQAAASPEAAARIINRLEGEGVNCTVGLLQLPASVLRREGVEPAQALDPCVNLRIGARLLLREWNKALQTGPGAPEAALAMALLGFEEITRSRSFVGILYPAEASDLPAPAIDREPEQEPAAENLSQTESASADSGTNLAKADGNGRSASSPQTRETRNLTPLIRIPGAGTEAGAGKDAPARTGLSRPEPVHVFPLELTGPGVSSDARLIF